MIIAIIYYARKKKKPPGEKYDFTGLGGVEIPKFGAIKPKGGRKAKSSAPRYHKHEERVREIFQKIFKVPFPTIRPAWLKNPVTNSNLEIDGYNETIRTPIGTGLGFEYDGGQHARLTPKFHRSVGDFQYQRAKDGWKDACFKKEKKVLIRIPDFVHYTDLERYIKTKLRREGFGMWIDRYENAQGKSGLYD